MYDIFENDTHSFEEGMLTYYTLPQPVQTAIKNNVTIGVAFVKKGDGSVRHMAFRRYLLRYNRIKNNYDYYKIFTTKNMMTVYDINIYLKNKKTMEFQKAAASSYRKIIIHNILGFLVGGQFYDTRETNKIRERFGEEIHNTLTKGMITALERDKQEFDLNAKEVESVNENYIQKSKQRLFELFSKVDKTLKPTSLGFTIRRQTRI